MSLLLVCRRVAGVCLVAILVALVGRSASASAFPTTCSPSNAAAPCDDTTGSLGEIIAWVSNGPASSPGQWRAILATIPQQWNTPLPNHWTSSVMQDFNTKIGRSVGILEGSPQDVAGVPVGSALTNVSDASFPFMPWTDGPSGTNEIHTELQSMDLVGGLCPCGNTQSTVPIHVRGGAGAGVATPSLGEVEALGSTSDFPARSFFDVFVEVDLPAPFGFTLVNHPSDPLVVSDSNLMSLPPRVVYIHSGQTNAVPMYVKSGAFAGELFGYLRLAGHMPNGFCGSRPIGQAPSVDCTDANFLINSIAEAPLMNCPGCNDICAGLPNGAPCSDADACTQDDACRSGACVGTVIQCDDGNGCTIDTCEPATGQCAFTPKDCNDNLACTIDACDPTGTCVHTPVDCDDNNPCTIDQCVQAFAANPCEVVPTGGTVSLPPAGCQYLSPSDVHKIATGLPVGTHIELGAIHRDFICHKPGGGGVCSFLNVNCTQGTPQAGEQECADSTLTLNLHGVGVPIPDRVLNVPINFETHVNPRTPGAPIQSFVTDMFRLQGQITGDPDFDLLRITAGTDFGMPSPGHTTLTLQGNGNYKVDSFFDITYRIDFMGAAGGHLGGMSGSTTGTIRMITGTGVGCTHTPVSCNDNNPCTNDLCSPTLGCVHTFNSDTCDDGNACTTGDVCSSGVCAGSPVSIFFSGPVSVSKPTVVGAEPDYNATISWPSSRTVDVVRGDLVGLRSSGGITNVNVGGCLANGLVGTSVIDNSVPATQAVYYLASGGIPAGCNVSASYREGVASEKPGAGGDRDADIAGDPDSCP